jgi:hypothetical protein
VDIGKIFLEAVMGFNKHQLDEIDEQERSQLGKNCDRFGTSVFYGDYTKKDGLCFDCKAEAEKAMEGDYE